MRYFPEELQAEFDANRNCLEPSGRLKDDFMYAGEEDRASWRSWTNGLPGLEGGTGLDSNGQPLQYGTGPHCVRSFRAALALARPRRIVEIGLNLGYGAVALLNLAPDAYLFSVDTSDRKETAAAARIIKERYGDRFDYKQTCSQTMILCGFSKKFDTIFIDGSHVETDIDADIEFGRTVGAKFFIFDDWWPCFGDVQKSIAKSGIEILFLHGNIAVGQESVL